MVQVPSSEQILKMAFVFRNSDGSIVGREADGGDIFTDVYPSTTSITIQEPTVQRFIQSLTIQYPVSATSPLADTIRMYINNVLVKQVAGTVLTDTLLADNFGQFWTKQWVKLVAKNDTASKADSFFYEVIPPLLLQRCQRGSSTESTISIPLQWYFPYMLPAKIIALRSAISRIGALIRNII